MNTTFRFPSARMMLLALVALMLSGLRASALEPTPAGELLVNNIRVNKVLFLGNSITLHGPAANIGWHGNWGMAASAQELDYVHLLMARIQKDSGGKPEIMVQNIADFERTHASYDLQEGLKDALEFKADLIIIAIGENVPGLDTPELQAGYRTAFDNLLAALRQQDNPTILVRGTFWTDATKNEIMAAASQHAGAIHVDLNGLDKDEKNFARAERAFEHAGVAAHPGDAGMLAIADAIWQQLKRQK